MSKKVHELKERDVWPDDIYRLYIVLRFVMCFALLKFLQNVHTINFDTFFGFFGSIGIVWIVYTLIDLLAGSPVPESKADRMPTIKYKN